MSARQHAVGHGHDGQGRARGLQLDVPSSGPESAGPQHAGARQLAVGPGPDVFEALCTAAAQKRQGFSALEAVNPLWGMAKAGTRRRDVFEALCTATAQMLQDFNARE